MKKQIAKRVLSIVLLATGIAAAYLVTIGPVNSEEWQELHVLSGAGLIKPMEELMNSFEKKYQVKTVVHYGGSGELMGQLAMKQPSDVFIPGAKKYIEDAQRKGWIVNKTVRDIVKHVPVIAVARDNPKQVKTLEDLTRPRVAIALGDSDGCAIGRLAESILKKNKLFEKIRQNIRVRTPTVNQLLLYVTIGKVDAAIVWEDMASWLESKEKLTIIRIPDEQNIEKTISIGVTTRSENKEIGKALCDFVAADAGRHIWSKWGFEPCLE